MNLQNPLTEQYQKSSNLEARIQLHERFSTSRQRWPVWVFDQLALPPTCHVLDLGCGVGKLWQDNLHRIPAGWSIVLADFSEGMIEQAKMNLSRSNRHFRFKVFDASGIPFKEKSFDAVIANHMLYHVPELNKTLSEIRRVLKPNGKLYASTNGVSHMRELDELTPSYIPHRPVGQVIASFTLENGEGLLKHFFPHVKLRKHDDSLVVREVAPLVGYALSRLTIFADRDQVDEIKKQALTKHIAERMYRQGGVIQITKDSGLFIASKR